jgi:hypothetical protein
MQMLRVQLPIMPRQTTVVVTIGFHAALGALQRIAKCGDVERFNMSEVQEIRAAADLIEKRMKEGQTYAYQYHSINTNSNT